MLISVGLYVFNVVCAARLAMCSVVQCTFLLDAAENLIKKKKRRRETFNYEKNPRNIH